jgi:hypothetical protein
VQLRAFSVTLDTVPPVISFSVNWMAASATAAVAYLTASDFIACYTGAMANVTEAELVEMVPGLRAMASVEVSGEVREALTRLAAQYAAMASECERLCMLPKKGLLPIQQADAAHV